MNGMDTITIRSAKISMIGFRRSEPVHTMDKIKDGAAELTGNAKKCGRREEFRRHVERAAVSYARSATPRPHRYLGYGPMLTPIRRRAGRPFESAGRKTATG